LNETPLRVGDFLTGFCGGAFGRDYGDDARVEAIGADWVVVRDDGGNVWFSEGDPDRLCAYRAA